MQLQRLVDGGQGMEAIGTRRANIQAEIYLCVRTNGGGHTVSL
jgi:hypothetical protein